MLISNWPQDFNTTSSYIRKRKTGGKNVISKYSSHRLNSRYISIYRYEYNKNIKKQKRKKKNRSREAGKKF